MKCFYHSADLDGHCAGAIVKNKYPDCEMIGINYGQSFPFDSIHPNEIVYMVDFCLQPFTDMEKLNSLCTLYWIDHHAKGSIDESLKCGFTASGGQYLNTDFAGCELTWKYIYPTDSVLPFAVYLLGRYDMWDHEDSRVLPFQYGVRQFDNTLPDNQELWSTLLNMNESQCETIVNTGAVLLAYEKNQNTKFCKAYAFETELNGKPAICANKGFCNSKLFDSIYDPMKHKLMITFIRLKPPVRKWTVSLYSTHPDINCGEIAKSFGGGGHKGAAGFQCEVLPFNI